MNKNMTQTKSVPVNPSVKSIEDLLNLPSIQPVAQFAYHEMAEVPVREEDVLEQLDRNIQSLSDLRSRLQFLNREIRYLMKV